MNFLVILTISLGILHLSQGFPYNHCFRLKHEELAKLHYEHVTLESRSAWDRDSHTFNDAAKICMIEIEVEFDGDDNCKEFDAYGIGDSKDDPTQAPTTIFVDEGCKAAFKVYYLPGHCEQVHLGSVLTCQNGTDSCPEQEVSATMPGNILGMYMHNGDEGEAPCVDIAQGNKDSWTYGWTDEKATVRNGCSSDWYICHDNDLNK